MESKLNEYFDEFSTDDTIAALSQKSFAAAITKNEDKDGNYFYRVRVGQHTVAKSKIFSEADERNAAMEDFIDWVEVALHDNRQRSFDFGLSG